MLLKEYWFRELASFDRTESYVRVIDGQVRCITPHFNPKDMHVAWNVQYIAVFVPAREHQKGKLQQHHGNQIHTTYLVRGHNSHQETTPQEPSESTRGAKPVLRRFSGPRIGSVGASCFVDDFVPCWGKRGAYPLLLEPGGSWLLIIWFRLVA